MNYSAEDYLNQLDVDKDVLVNALNELGQVSSSTETFTELVPKVEPALNVFFNKNITSDVAGTSENAYPTQINTELLMRCINIPSDLQLIIPEGVTVAKDLLKMYTNSVAPKIIIPSTLTTLSLNHYLLVYSGYQGAVLEPVTVEGDFSNITSLSELTGALMKGLILNNTSNNVYYLTNAANLFKVNSNQTEYPFKTLRVNNIKFGNVTNFDYTFYNTFKLIDNQVDLDSINAAKEMLSTVNTSNCTSFQYMFENTANQWSNPITDSSQNTVDFTIDSWDLQRATSLVGMFAACFLRNLTLNNLSTPLTCNWDLFKKDSTYNAGTTCRIHNLTLSNINFGPCNNFLRFTGSDSNYIYVTNCVFNNWDTSLVTNMSRLVHGYKGDARALVTALLPNLNTVSVTDMSYMFSLVGNSSYYSPTTYMLGTDFTQLLNFKTNNVTNMEHMFYGYCKILSNNDAEVPTTFDVSTFDTSNVTDMRYMFANCGRAKSTDSATFSYDYYPIIGLDNWDTSNVTNMSAMFKGARGALYNVVLNWDTSKVTDMSSMFQSYATPNLDVAIASFDTRAVTLFDYMFDNYTNTYNPVATTLDLSNFETGPNIQSYTSHNMFNGCTTLTHLDIRGLDLTKTNNISTILGTGNNKVPVNCVIIVKDADSKNALQNAYPTHTSIYTAAEYTAL